jgi:hypothetical protein
MRAGQDLHAAILILLDGEAGAVRELLGPAPEARA